MVKAIAFLAMAVFLELNGLNDPAPAAKGQPMSPLAPLALLGAVLAVLVIVQARRVWPAWRRWFGEGEAAVEAVGSEDRAARRGHGKRVAIIGGILILADLAAAMTLAAGGPLARGLAAFAFAGFLPVVGLYTIARGELLRSYYERLVP